jgi:hypothetical protein
MLLAIAPLTLQAQQVLLRIKPRVGDTMFTRFEQQV